MYVCACMHACVQNENTAALWSLLVGLEKEGQNKMKQTR